MSHPLNSRGIDHQRAVRLVLAFTEHDGNAFTEAMRELAQDRFNAATSGCLFALVTMASQTGVAALGDQLPDTLRAALLELSLRDAEPDATDEPHG